MGGGGWKEGSGRGGSWEGRRMGRLEGLSDPCLLQRREEEEMSGWGEIRRAIGLEEREG